MGKRIRHKRELMIVFCICTLLLYQVYVMDKQLQKSVEEFSGLSYKRGTGSPSQAGLNQSTGLNSNTTFVKHMMPYDEIKHRFHARSTILQNTCKVYYNSTRFRPRFQPPLKSAGPLWPFMNATLRFCLVPKNGFKTWWDIFHEINKELERLGAASFASGSKVLAKGNNPANNGLPGMQNTFRSVRQVSAIFVREPYSRLLSAYVDELYVPNSFFDTIGKYIVGTFRRNPSAESLKMGHDVTFAEFVRYVIHAETTGQRRDPHFSPVYTQCGICKIDFQYIGHMETFVDDTVFILNASQAPVKYTRNHDEFTMREDLEYKLEKYPFKSMSMEKGLKRLWRSWQTRGVLSKQEAFPIAALGPHLETGNPVTVDTMARLAMAALARSGPKTLRQRQKSEAMREAFSAVPMENRLKLKDIFALDFRLFGYDPEPEDVFNLPEMTEFENSDTFRFFGPL